MIRIGGKEIRGPADRLKSWLGHPYISGLFSMGARAALAPAILGYFITISQGQHPQWKKSINAQHPQY